MEYERQVKDARITFTYKEGKSEKIFDSVADIYLMYIDGVMSLGIHGKKPINFMWYLPNIKMEDIEMLNEHLEIETYGLRDVKNIQVRSEPKYKTKLRALVHYFKPGARNPGTLVRLVVDDPVSKLIKSLVDSRSF